MGEKIMCKLMEDSIKKIQKTLSDNEYIDDCGWGDNCFRIRIFKCIKPPKTKLVDDYMFIYDEDDVFERTVEQQVADWLNNIIV